jgi:hypothetical protein
MAMITITITAMITTTTIMTMTTITTTMVTVIIITTITIMTMPGIPIVLWKIGSRAMRSAWPSACPFLRLS